MKGRLAHLAFCVLLLAPAALTAASPPLVVRGTVLAPGGRALAGATVTAQAVPTAYQALSAMLDDGEPDGARDGAAPLTRTDREGRFELPVPAVGVWQVDVHGEGLVAMRYPLLPVVEGVELPVVTLRPAASAAVEVVDRDGAPVAGLLVAATSADRGLWSDPPSVGWRPAPRFGHTGHDGRLLLPRARGERLDLHLLAPDRGEPQQLTGVRGGRFVAAPPTTDVSTVEILGADAAPQAGALIATADGPWPLGRTDPRGRWSGCLARGSAWRVFAPDGRTLDVAAEPATADLTTSPPSALAPRTVLHLPDLAATAGRVVTTAGDPAAAALVWPGHDPGRYVLSDGTGHFHLPLPSTGDGRVQAHAPGYPPAPATIPANVPATADLTLTLAPGWTLRGRLLDDTGKPYPAARLAVLGPPAVAGVLSLDRAAARATTGADGRFSLPTLPRSGELVLRVAGDGIPPQLFPLVPPEAEIGSAEQEVVLQRGRRAFGWVRDLAERPVAGARILAEPVGEPSARSTGRDGDGNAPPPAAVSGPDGRFELAGLDAAVIDLQASAAGFAPTRVRGVRLPDGTAAVDLGTILLATGASLAGRVTDTEGAAIAGAAVWNLGSEERSTAHLFGPPDREPDAETDADGRFRLDDLPSELAAALVADAPGHSPARSGDLALPHEGELRIELPAAFQLIGRVTDADGAPVAGAEIELSPAATAATEGIEGAPSPERASLPAALDRARTARTDDDGRYRFEDLAPRRFTVEAFADGFRPSPSSAVEVRQAAAATRADFILERGAELAGSVVDTDGAAIAGARVRIGKATASSSDDGAFRLAGLDPGLAQVLVDHPGYNRIVRELEIADGSNQAEFVLAGGLAVSGWVLDESELPVAGAAVALEPLDPGAYVDYRTTSDGDGAFVLDRVALGSYRASAEWRGAVTAGGGEEIRVADAPVEGLEVRIQQGGRIEGRILGLDFEELARVTVTAQAPGRSARAGEVDFEGRYAVSGLEADDWTLRAALPGGRREARARVTLEAGSPRMSRDLEFGRGLSLTGWVLHADEPLAGAEVSLRPAAAQGSGSLAERATVTDAAGRFELADLAAGSYQVGVTHRARNLIHNQLLALSGDRELLIEIETATVAGTVISARSARPIAAARISLLQTLEPTTTGSRFTLASDDAGRFRYDRLPGGQFRLSVNAEGFQPSERTVDVAPGGETQLQLELEPAAGLEVLVQLADGTIPEYVTLWGRSGRGESFSETRAVWREGLTPFSTLPAGDWELWISATGGTAVPRRVSVPSEPLALVLPNAGALQVRVPALVEGEPPALLTVLGADGRAHLHLAWGGQLQTSWPLTAGRATVEGVPAGSWSLEVQTADGRHFVGTAVTTGGPLVEVQLE